MSLVDQHGTYPTPFQYVKDPSNVFHYIFRRSKTHQMCLTTSLDDQLFLRNRCTGKVWKGIWSKNL